MTEKREKILIVDDERFYIDVLVDLLQDDYALVIAKNGAQALERMRDEPPPDLVLLDVILPDMDGYEVCRRIKAENGLPPVPIIFLTVKSDVDDEIRGFELGAVDYIAKPMSPPIVKARVATQLALKRGCEALLKHNQLLEERVRERTREIAQTQDVAIFCLASLAETRDNETGNHIRRTQNYVRLLADQLKDKEGFREVLDEDFIELLFKSAPLHDIGKVGVPDHILLKPGPLSRDEWTEMKRHTLYGKQAIERSEEDFGTTTFLHIAKEIAYSHHEKWDGSGYPLGLRGADIPVAGRLMALADVYDALISRRVYKEAFPHEQAVDMIVAERGRHFDPDVTDAFLALRDDFREISLRYAD
ncbi:MAG TPA: two-component system response regulator [Chromatiaceae bacterium]|nr:two-component system response regulator [Chromatiaceae bacterium]